VAVVTDRDDLLSLVRAQAIVHGRVTLSSGREADYYVDLRRTTLSAAAAPLVGRVMLELTADLDYDAVGGLTMGADPVAAAMLHAAAAQGTRLDAFVVRKQAKAPSSMVSLCRSRDTRLNCAARWRGWSTNALAPNWPRT